MSITVTKNGLAESILEKELKQQGFAVVRNDDTLTEGIKMGRVHVSQISPKDIDGLKDDVFGIANESPVVQELINLLGIQDDGTPVRIRTGFMSYDKSKKILFFSKFKYDMPGLVGMQPKK